MNRARSLAFAMFKLRRVAYKSKSTSFLSFPSLSRYFFLIPLHYLYSFISISFITFYYPISAFPLAMVYSFSSPKAIQADQNTLASSICNVKNLSEPEEAPYEEPIAVSPVNDDAETASNNKKTKEPSVHLCRLFRFATPLDRCLLLIATVFSVGIGALQPSMVIIFGNLLGSIGEVFATSVDGACHPSSAGIDATMGLILTFVYMGTAVFLAAYLSNAIWVYCGVSIKRATGNRNC